MIEKQLEKLKTITIPRYFLRDTDKLHYLHVFCDVSKIAYATCIFIWTGNELDNSCQLVQARRREAPVKSISIPSLELLASNIGVRLENSVKTHVRLNDIPFFYWTDSANGLYWNKRNKNCAPFVFNTVSEIHSLSDPENWHFISVQLNPDNLTSTGCTAEDLAKSKWRERAQWLINPVAEWPKSEFFLNFEIKDAEKKKSVVSASNINLPTNLW